MNRKTKRLIKEVMNFETGEYFNTDVFFQKSIDEIHFYRSELDRAIKNKRIKLFVCPICKQLVRIRGGIPNNGEEKKQAFHFAHLADTKECPIKTNYHLPEEIVNRIKYLGVRESLKHIDLKNKIAESLRRNEINKGDFSYIEIEKVVKSDITDKEWKKPDVKSVYRNRKVVFELQISTTWLSVITKRQEFYKENGIYIVWLFDKFDVNDDTRELTYNDVIYTNNQNALVFDDEMYQRSIEENDMVVRVFYNTFYLDGLNMKNEWKNEIVGFSEMKFDPHNYKVFYYDSSADKKKCEQKKLLLIELEEKKERTRQQQILEKQKKQEAERQTKINRHYNLENNKIPKIKRKIEELRDNQIRDKETEIKHIERQINHLIDHLENFTPLFQEITKFDYPIPINIFRNSETIENEIKEKFKDEIESYRNFKLKQNELNKSKADILNRLCEIKKLPEKKIGEKPFRVLNPKDNRHLEFIKFNVDDLKVIRREYVGELFGSINVEPLKNSFPNIERLPFNKFLNDYMIIYSFEDKIKSYQENIETLNVQLKDIENEIDNFKDSIKQQIEKYIDEKLILLDEQRKLKIVENNFLKKILESKQKKYDLLLKEFNNLDGVLS